MVMTFLVDIISVVKGSSPSGLLQFLQSSGYFILFFLMSIEGPIVTYVASFAASLGIFNIFYVFILSSLGNILGDMVLFYIGRFSKKKSVEKYELKSLKPSRMDRLRGYLERNPGRAIATVKFTPFVVVPGLVFIGSTSIKFRKFLLYSVLASMTYSLSMTLLGFFSGVAFLTIARYVKYIEYLIGIAIVIGFLVYFIIKFISKRISKKMGKI